MSYRDYMNAFRYFALDRGRNLSLKIKLPILKKTMRKKNLYVTLAFMLMLSIVGCKKDTVDPNESELITTVKVVLTEKVSGTQSIF